MPQKKKSSKPKQPSNAGRAAPVGRRKTTPTGQVVNRPRAIPRGLTEQVCGLSDPFCAHAMGAKLPDNAGIRSLTYPVHSRYTIVSNAQGDAASLLLPQYLYAPQTEGVVIAGIATYGAVLPLASRLANVDSYRINSMGVRIRRISAPLTSSGMVYIRGFSGLNGTELAALSCAGYLCDFSSDVALQDCKEVAVTFKRTDQRSRLFHQPSESSTSSSVSGWNSPGWGALQISLIGGPASVSVLEVEVFLNMEVTFEDAEALALLATPSVRASSVTNDVVDYIASEARTVFLSGAREASNWFQREATNALRQKLASGMTLALMP